MLGASVQNMRPSDCPLQVCRNHEVHSLELPVDVTQKQTHYKSIRKFDFILLEILRLRTMQKAIS